MKNKLMDVIKGLFYVLLVSIAILSGSAFIGWALGTAAATKNPPPMWYCIEGKVYEKLGDYYSTVVPARACIPVDKD